MLAPNDIRDKKLTWVDADLALFVAARYFVETAITHARLQATVKAAQKIASFVHQRRLNWLNTQEATDEWEACLAQVNFESYQELHGEDGAIVQGYDPSTAHLLFDGFKAVLQDLHGGWVGAWVRVNVYVCVPMYLSVHPPPNSTHLPTHTHTHKGNRVTEQLALDLFHDLSDEVEYRQREYTQESDDNASGDGDGTFDYCAAFAFVMGHSGLRVHKAPTTAEEQ